MAYDEPSVPYNITWNWGELQNRCTIISIADQVGPVEEGGLSCVYMGHITGRNCDGQNNYAALDISYNADSVVYSGSTRVWWEYRYNQSFNEMALENESPGTSLCVNKVHCVGKRQDWSYWDQSVWVSCAVSLPPPMAPLGHTFTPDPTSTILAYIPESGAS